MIILRNCSGGTGWTRTNEAVKQRFYRPPPLPLGTQMPYFNYTAWIIHALEYETQQRGTF